jgi:hypothetical protein
MVSVVASVTRCGSPKHCTGYGLFKSVEGNEGHYLFRLQACDEDVLLNYAMKHSEHNFKNVPTR